MAHDKGSFSYKVINKKIRDILDARSELDNTAQIAMPFIKATTTISVGDDGTGFTLGLHAFNEDVKYENIYSESEDSSMPLIGYTYLKDGTNNVGQRRMCGPCSTRELFPIITSLLIVPPKG